MNPMIWVIFVVPLRLRFVAHQDFINDVGFRYFQGRAEYVLCVEGTVTDSVIRFDTKRLARARWVNGKSAFPPSSEPFCAEHPATMMMLHPHLAGWRPATLLQRGGAVSNCQISPEDQLAWRVSALPLAVVQCDFFIWAVFLERQLARAAAAESLFPAVLLNWNLREYVIPGRP